MLNPPPVRPRAETHRHPLEKAAAPAAVAAVCDVSPAAMNATWRAASLARQLQVPMRLLHVDPASGRSRSGAAIEHFIEESRRRLGVDVTPVQVNAESLVESLLAAREGLIVVPTANGNPLRERIMGSPTERLIRLARAPVLIVKQQASGACRRVLVAVDLREHSELLVAAAGRLARGSSMAVLHSIASRRDPQAPPASEALRVAGELARRVGSRIERLLPARPGGTAEVPSGRPGAMPVIAFGNPAESILAGEARHEADLVVIGKRRRGLLADFLLGGVTQRVVARCRADVLVVPMPPERAQ